MSCLLLAPAIAAEITATISLKLPNGFSGLVPSKWGRHGENAA